MTKLLIIYTGGTIGMMTDPATGALKAFDFEQIKTQTPELSRFDYVLDVHSFSPVIDSSDMQPAVWVELAGIIQENYTKYDGFVILHGTDTMSYTASALSFMLENLQKPVIFTGSQLPIGVIRTDAKENLVTAIEIAAEKKNGAPLIQEVCVFFDYKLMRGNRTFKASAISYNAFQSANYPVLAEAGVHISYNHNAINHFVKGSFTINTSLDANVGLLKIYPGISPQLVKAVLNTEGLKALVLETFGAGNAPTQPWFLEALQQATNKGLIIYNVTQCIEGAVEQGRYATSTGLKKLGVVSGYDITAEAALTKLMYLLGQGLPLETIKQQLEISLRGELTN